MQCFKCWGRNGYLRDVLAVKMAYKGPYSSVLCPHVSHAPFPVAHLGLFFRPQPIPLKEKYVSGMKPSQT